MKELMFLRHAKSSWENEVEDRNRPLTENGVKRIQAIANASKAVFQPFEIVFSSPANRALHTACIMMYETQRSFNELQVREAPIHLQCFRYFTFCQVFTRKLLQSNLCWS